MLWSEIIIKACQFHLAQACFGQRLSSRLASSTLRNHALVRDYYQGLPVPPGTSMLWSAIIIKACQFHLAQACFGQRLLSRLASSTWRNHALVRGYYQGLPVPPDTSMLWSAIIIKACQFHLAQARFGQRLLSRLASSTWHKHALVSDYYQGLPVPPGTSMLWSAIIIKACQFHLAQARFGQRLLSRLASSTWRNHALVRDYYQGLPVPPGTSTLWSAIIIKACQFHLAQSCFGQRLLSRLASSTWHKHALVRDYYQGLPVPPGAIMLWSAIIIKACQFHLAQARFGQRLLSRLASSTWHKHALVSDYYQGLPVPPGTSTLWSAIIIKACQFHLAQARFGQRLLSRLASSTWRNHALVSDYYQGLPVPPGTSTLWSAIIIKACQFHLAQVCFGQRLLSRLASSTWHKLALVRDYNQGLPVPPGAIMLWSAIIIKACQFHLAQACFGQRLLSRLASSTWHKHALVRDYYQGLPVPPGTSMLWPEIVIKACQFHLAQVCFGQRLLSRLASSTWHKHALVRDYWIASSTWHKLALVRDKYQGLPVPPGAIMLWSAIIIKVCQFHLAQSCFGQRLVSRLASSTWPHHALVRDNYQGLPVLPGTIMLWSEIIIKACQFHLAQACFGQRLSSRLASSTWRNHALVRDYYQGLPVPPGTSMLWSAIIIKACQFHLAQSCFGQRLVSRLASSTLHKHALVRDYYQGLPVLPGTIMLWSEIIIKACQFHLAQACFGQRLSSRLASSTWRNHALVRDYYQGLPVPPGTSMLWSAIIIKACQFHLAQARFGQRLLSRLASSTWHKHALVRDYYQGLPVPPGTSMLWSAIIIKACHFHLAQACFGQRLLSRLASSTWHKHALVRDYYQGLPVPPGAIMLWSAIIIKACQFHLAQACFGQRLLSRLASSTWHKLALVRDYYQGLPVPPGAIMLWSAIIIQACQFHLAQACFGQRLLSRLASSTWHRHALVCDYYQGLPVPPCTSMLWSEIIIKACQFYLAQVCFVRDYCQGLPVPPCTSMLWSEIIGLPVPPGTSLLWSEISIKACQFHLAQSCFGQRLSSRFASFTWHNHALVSD